MDTLKCKCIKIKGNDYDKGRIIKNQRHAVHSG